MHDHKRRDSLIPTMNRRVFLATMGVAAAASCWVPHSLAAERGPIGPPEQRSNSALLSPRPNMVGPYATVC